MSTSALEQNLRNSGRVTAEELMPGDVVVLGHWHGFTTRQLFLVLSTSLVDRSKLGLCVDVTLLGDGHVDKWIWHKHQWIEVHRT